ncbi:MAG: JmjC domain-containing protein, partial [Pseudonocardia sp.]
MDHRLITNIEKALGWSGPAGVGEFARGTLPDPELCERLMTPQRLLDLLMRGAVGLPGVRCLRAGGVDLHPNTFTTTVENQRGPHIPVLDMDRIARLLGEGVTLVADAVNVVDPTLEVACRALRWWSHELVRVNAYLTTGTAAGFPLHWDDHDVIVVQVSGAKTWQVRGASRVAPMFRDAAPNNEPPEDVLWEGALTAGDVMHIPRGYWHQATRADRNEHGHSLHLTFGFTRRTGVDWLGWVADRSRGVEALRHDLPRWDDPVMRDEHTEHLTELATGLVTDQPPAAMLDEVARTRRPARHVATNGLFGAPEAVVAITEFRPHLQVDDEQVVVEGAG